MERERERETRQRRAMSREVYAEQIKVLLGDDMKTEKDAEEQSESTEEEDDGDEENVRYTSALPGLSWIKGLRTAFENVLRPTETPAASSSSAKGKEKEVKQSAGASLSSAPKSKPAPLPTVPKGGASGSSTIRRIIEDDDDEDEEGEEEIERTAKRRRIRRMSDTVRRSSEPSFEGEDEQIVKKSSRVKKRQLGRQVVRKKFERARGAGVDDDDDHERQQADMDRQAEPDQQADGEDIDEEEELEEEEDDVLCESVSRLERSDSANDFLYTAPLARRIARQRARDERDIGFLTPRERDELYWRPFRIEMNQLPNGVNFLANPTREYLRRRVLHMNGIDPGPTPNEHIFQTRHALAAFTRRAARRTGHVWTPRQIQALEKGMKEHGTAWRTIASTVKELKDGNIRPDQCNNKARVEREKRKKAGVPLGVWELAAPRYTEEYEAELCAEHGLVMLYH
ncbi:hypothetical protein BJ742DRAFT_742320 [Cladochytrium replicatum]|nr:hypothetical protein BJ742DRAFT_742320 [Cladochytrium replicatum]